MKYALFLGCTVPVRASIYEQSARLVLEKLGVEIVNLEEMACCGYPIKSTSVESSLTLAARNLAIAQQAGVDIISLCSACTGVLAEANEELRHDHSLLETINSNLREVGKEYSGKVEVKHFARFLYEDIGLDRLKEHIKTDLSNISFAPHYGCHYTKPSRVFKDFDNVEFPQSLDKLINATGAKSVDYYNKLNCCGGAILAVDERTALTMTKDKLDNIKESGASGIIVICPFCNVMYESNQRKIEKDFEAEKYDIPVLFYPQLLGLAMGMELNELGLQKYKKTLLSTIEVPV